MILVEQDSLPSEWPANTIVRPLPGFVRNGVTYECYHMTLYVIPNNDNTRAKGMRGSYLTVEHGRKENYVISSSLFNATVFAYLALDDQDLFALLYVLWDAQYKAQRWQRERTAHVYTQAFTEGRLKKRKVRRSQAYRVWIEEKESHV